MAAMLSAMDDSVGNIMDELKRLGVDENTLTPTASKIVGAISIDAQGSLETIPVWIFPGQCIIPGSLIPPSNKLPLCPLNFPAVPP